MNEAHFQKRKTEIDSFFEDWRGNIFFVYVAEGGGREHAKIARRPGVFQNQAELFGCLRVDSNSS